MAKIEPKPKPDPVYTALLSGLALLLRMEEAGAIRLPFPGYAETIRQMRAAVKK